MAKLTSVATDFIRRVFSREKQNSELAVSTKDLARAQMGMGIGLGNVDTMGVGGIGDVLGLDKRLLHRYADYEEMDEYPDITSSLDIYSDDSSQMDSENKHVLWVECQDQDVCDDLTDVFHKRLKIDQNAWEIIRTLCKYGNDFEEIVIGDKGVQELNYLPPATCRRVESKRGDFLGVVQSFSSNMEVNEQQFEQMKTKSGSAVSPQGDSAVFEDWRVTHMRLRSKNRESMYGWSIAEPARWIWRRLMLLEDAVLVYKLTRSPSRYAFYIDVGNLPREEAERAIQNVKNRIKKKKFVNPKTGKLDMRFNPLSFDEDFFLGMRDGQEKTRVDVLNGPSYQQVEDVQYFLYKLYAALKVPRAYLGYDENMPSKATLCLAGDTPIPLLDGTEPTIAELSKRDDPFWLYSIDENNNVVPGLGKNARVTRRQAETVEVELDNGEVLTCTPDHPVMRRDGSYCEAQELAAGDSLMPLYRRDSEGSLRGYEEVYHPGDDSWGMTHRVVTDTLFEEVEKGNVRHHVNFDKRDNRPENLEIMAWDDHRKLHAEHAEKTIGRPDVIEKRKAAQAAWLKTDEAKESIAKASAMSKRPGSKFWDWVHSDEHRDLKSRQMKEQWSDPGGAMRLSRGDGFREKMSAIMVDRIEDGTAPDTAGEKNSRWRSDATIEHLIRVAREYRCKSKKQLVKWSGYSEALINRVLSQHGISYRLFAGEYMASSVMRDAAYRSSRAGRNHKVVSVRPGPVIDTYDLTVEGYHNFAIGQGVVVHNSQEDVRFAKTVLRVQNEFINGMRKVARVHLAARKIDPMAVDFKINMTVPSAIFELGQMEVRRARADLASMMERHVSSYFLLSNVYGLSDDEIAEITKQKKEEQKMAGPTGGFESVETPAARGISERELFDGDRADEKAALEAIRREMEKRDSKLGTQLRETQMLIREIARATSGVAW